MFKVGDKVQFVDGHSFCGVSFDGKWFEVIYINKNNLQVKAIHDLDLPSVSRGHIGFDGVWIKLESMADFEMDNYGTMFNSFFGSDTGHGYYTFRDQVEYDQFMSRIHKIIKTGK